MLLAAVAPAAANPPIRTTPANVVPSCATPERLMAFLESRNTRLDPRHVGIARHYKRHGEALGVRWDYAFFQMALETNYLTFRRPDGSAADVSIRQNNFAGIGATGGGVPGDSFPDVSTGVLAQLQHLVAYSGERVARPVAPRTRLKQDDIVAASAVLGRPVRFSDLARRWAADPAYHRSIESIAAAFRKAHCDGMQQAAAPVPVAPPAPMVRSPWSPPSALGGEPQLRREPAPAAVRAPAVAGAKQVLPFKTVWRRAAPGDMPPLGSPQPAVRRAKPAEPAPTVVAALTKPHTVQPSEVPPPGAMPPPVAAATPAQPTLPLAPDTDAPLLAAWANLARGLSVESFPSAPAPVPAAEAPVATPIPPPAAARPCRIVTSSGGTGEAPAVLVRSDLPDGIQLTVIAAADGSVLLEPGSVVAGMKGESTVVGSFATPAAAVARAKEQCPGARLGGGFGGPELARR